MDYQQIILDKSDGIATLTLNRPEKLNAVGERATEEIVAALADVKKDKDTRVVVITGAGRGFCSGADVGGLGDRSTDEEMTLNGRRESLRRGFQRVPLSIQNLDKPAIAAVNGVAGGLGMDLAMACDIRIASEAARFGELFIRIGLFPGTGGTWFLPRLVGIGRACELIWTGDMIDAVEAERIGLVNRVVPADRLLPEALTLAGRLAQGPSLAISLSKVAIHQGLNQNLAEALEYAATAEAITLSSEDHREGIRAFAEKRPPVYRGR